MSVNVVKTNGTGLDAHYYQLGGNAKPGILGKREGCRCAHSGDKRNWSMNGLHYRSLEDIAHYIKANLDWGVRATKAPIQSLRYDNIFTDGEQR